MIRPLNVDAILFVFVFRIKSYKLVCWEILKLYHKFYLITEQL